VVNPGARARPVLGQSGRAVLHRRSRHRICLHPVSIAALAGVAEHEAGLASGLINTSQQLGGAIGIAIASTIAATHAGTLLHQGAAPAAALTSGFQWAFWACGTLGLAAVPVTYLLVRRNELAFRPGR